ncbi:MAG: NAD(P)H-dependent oxidoreductase subunit E [Lewinellaceae bacterium]|nr:NAD(P)H-dependent oxidoreductase subunit E [Lewinellaceae bacterium]
MQPNRTQLLNRLWEFQRRSGYIRDEDIQACAQWLGLSSIEIEGVVSFYHFFHRKPAGAVSIYVDNSIIADHAGYADIVAAFETSTGAKLGGTDPSGLFGLFSTACIGLSDQSPAALINFQPFTLLTPEKVEHIVGQIRQGVPVAQLADPVLPNIQYLPPGEKTIFFRDFIPGSALAAGARKGAAEIIADLKNSELSGRGGAYFPSWIKWKACREYSSETKYVVCNADEGEPGTFKDRVLLQACPETVLEGMILAAYTIGASEGIIYLRAEYFWLLPRLETALQHYRSKGLLGKDAGGVSGFNFDIRIQLGAGAYVCGRKRPCSNPWKANAANPVPNGSSPWRKDTCSSPHSSATSKPLPRPPTSSRWEQLPGTPAVYPVRQAPNSSACRAIAAGQDSTKSSGGCLLPICWIFATPAIRIISRSAAPPVSASPWPKKIAAFPCSTCWNAKTFAVAALLWYSTRSATWSAYCSTFPLFSSMNPAASALPAGLATSSSNGKLKKSTAVWPNLPTSTISATGVP